MNVLLLLAGLISLVTAAIHGAVGERLVIRELSPGTLPATRLGDATATLSMIRIAWHMASIGLASVGIMLIAGGVAVDGDLAVGLGLAGAGLSTAFTVFILSRVAIEDRSLSAIVKDVRLLLLTAIPILAWLGVAST